MPAYYYVISAGLFAAIFIWKKRWALSLLIAYMFLIISYTILTRTPSPNAKASFIPFWSYLALIGVIKSPVRRLMLFLQIIANIAMFIPVGILAGRILGKKGILLGMCFSASIEITQLITHRGLFEFDDIIHNTLGTAIGVGICFGIGHIKGRERGQG